MSGTALRQCRGAWAWERLLNLERALLEQQAPEQKVNQQKDQESQTTTVAAGLMRLQVQLQWQWQFEAPTAGLEPKSGRLISRTT